MSVLKQLLLPLAESSDDTAALKVRTRNLLWRQAQEKLDALGFPYQGNGYEATHMREITTKLHVVKFSSYMLSVGTDKHQPYVDGNKDIYCLVYDKATRVGNILQFVVLHVWIGNDEYGTVVKPPTDVMDGGNLPESGLTVGQRKSGIGDR